MTHLSTKRGELDIDDDGVEFDESVLRIWPKFYRDLYREKRRQFYLLTFALTLGVGYLLLLYALDLSVFPREWAGAAIAAIVVASLLLIGLSELKRLRPSVSSARYVPRDAIDTVYFSYGGRTHAPRFVIEFADGGTTRYRLVEFNRIEPVDEGRRVFESLGLEPKQPPPPIGLGGHIRRTLGRARTPAPEEERTPAEEPASLDPDARISRWWMLLVVPLALQVLFAASGRVAVILSESGQSALLALSFALAFWILEFPTFPLAPIAMFLDARRIRSSAAAWNPRPLVWAVAGVMPAVVFVVSPTGMTLTAVLAWGGYLVRRYAAIGLR